MNLISNTNIKSTLREFAGAIILIGEGLLLIVLITNFFVPSYNEVIQMRDDISIKDAKLLDLSNYARYLKELADSSLAVEEDVVNYALPSENDVITLILTYEGLAQTEGVVVSPISLSPGVLRKEESDIEDGQSGVQEVVFAMGIEAENKEAAQKIIQEITNTRRIFNIVNLSWTAKDAEGVDGVIDLGVSLATYYYIRPTVFNSGKSVVEKGQEQIDFIEKLKQTKQYEDLILTDVQVGKEDLFEQSPAIAQARETTPQQEEAIESEETASAELEVEDELEDIIQ